MFNLIGALVCSGVIIIGLIIMVFYNTYAIGNLQDQVNMLAEDVFYLH